MASDNPQWPKTVEEAVAVLLAEMTDADKAHVAGLRRDELTRLHFGLGISIRNRLGLWQGNQELLNSCSAWSPFVHPDSASPVIIEALWDALQSHP